MKLARYQSSLRLAVFALAAAIALCAAMPVAALGPDSPRVRRMIDSGLKYLENAKEARLGGKCVIGLCFVKEGADASHAKVAEAVEACQQFAKETKVQNTSDVYSVGIAIVFLCELDSQKYRPEIQRLVELLAAWQKPHGGWGYPDRNSVNTGDTSMTQYAVLGFWTASQHNFDVPQPAAEGVCDWLIRTQDPSGLWGYQGSDPGDEVYQRVKQTPQRMSLSAAGLGSVYVCSDLLGLAAGEEDREVPSLPAAFKRLEEEKKPRRAILKSVQPKLLRRAQLDGKRWLADNFEIKDEQHTYYFLYALERYMSFHELVEGTSPDETWYDTGVGFLESRQEKNGMWPGRLGAAVDTGFALLFLMRSTKKTIQSVGDLRDGTLVGGRGLPSDARRVRLQDGRITATPFTGVLDDVLARLEDLQQAEQPAPIQFSDTEILSKDPSKRREQLTRLRRLLRDGSPTAQVVAAGALARSGDFDSAPELIAALANKDPRVVRAARDGLRRLSRKFDGFGLADRPSRVEITEAAEKWKKWYHELPRGD